MNLGAICTRELVTLDAGAPVRDGARLMRDHHVGCVVVTQAAEGGQRAVGVVIDRDLAIQVLAQEVDGSRLPLGQLVEGQRLHGIGAEASLGEAIGRMETAGVRRLLVHDGEGHLVGIVSLDDLLRACAAQLAGLAAVMPRAAEHEAAQRARAAAPAPRVRVPASGTAGWSDDWGTARD